MKRALSVLLILAVVQCEAQVNKGMPDFNDVVKTFFSTYSRPLYDITYLRFEKRKDGWYAAEVNYRPSGSNQPPKLFWNKATASYKVLPYQVRDEKDTVTVKDATATFMSFTGIDETTLYCYKRNLFFGYGGWDKDVINELEKTPVLSDSLYESLARAYSNYAINYFYDQWGFADHETDADRTVLSDREPVPVSRVKKFMFYEDKAIATYRKLLTLNPGYKALTGTVKDKLTNELMFAYSTLHFLEFEKEAVGYLKGVSFPDSVMLPVQNALEEVKPNSIFITFGDNVTYPVWYLQSQGIRTDVITVDYGLLALRRVLRFLDKKYRHTLFETDSAVYLQPIMDYSRLERDMATDSSVALDAFLDSLYASPKIHSMQKGDREITYTQDTTFKFYTNNVFLPVNANDAKKLYGVGPFRERIKVPVADYMLMNQILALSVIRVNFLKKRIYFFYPPDGSDWNGAIARRTYIYELTPAQ